MAHRLSSGLSLRCSVPHGHNEFVRVFLEPTSSRRLDGKTNVMTLFETAKQRWHAFVDGTLDHSLHLAEEDPLVHYFRTQEPKHLPRLLLTPGDPTTEILCACLMSKAQVFLAASEVPLKCVKILIEETPTNTVTLEGAMAYEKVLPLTSRPNALPWWRRADDSINDLSLAT